MLKQLGITTVALAGLLGFAAPKKADARVHFGVYVGGPAYTYAPPVAPAPVAPYAYGPDYYDYPAPAYVAPPAYVDPYYAAPSYGFGFGFGGHDHWRHEEHERFEHGFRGGGHHGRR